MTGAERNLYDGARRRKSDRSGGVKQHKHRHKLKHRFQFVKTLGRGTYGKVKLATEIETGEQVCAAIFVISLLCGLHSFKLTQTASWNKFKHLHDLVIIYYIALTKCYQRPSGAMGCSFLAAPHFLNWDHHLWLSSARLQGQWYCRSIKCIWPLGWNDLKIP